MRWNSSHYILSSDSFTDTFLVRVNTLRNFFFLSLSYPSHIRLGVNTKPHALSTCLTKLRSGHFCVEVAGSCNAVIDDDENMSLSWGRCVLALEYLLSSKRMSRSIIVFSREDSLSHVMPTELINWTIVCSRSLDILWDTIDIALTLYARKLHHKCHPPTGTKTKQSCPLSINRN